MTLRSFSEAGKVYKCDESFFKVIDTEEKAYILGFLYADGYNHVNKNAISIRLNNIDEEILFKIRKAMCSNHPIHRYGVKQNSNFTIVSKQLSKDLEALGCMQAKSAILEYPKDKISKPLERHFIRGYFDGDGCISETFKSGYYDVILNVTSTFDFLINVQSILIEECNVSKVKFSKRRPCGPSFSMAYHGRQNCLKVLKYLYDDSTIFLNRKFQKYKSIPIW